MHKQSESPSFDAVKTPISQEALDQLFREARTHSAWLPEPVPVELLHKAYELARLGATSANGSPGRFVFLTTPGAKARLKPVLAPGNVEKTMAAPATVIVAWDTEFHEKLPRLFPQADMRSYFVGNKPLIEENAFRNSSLHARWGWIAGRCPASTRPNSMRNFFRTESGRSTFSAIWDMETKTSSTRATLAWSLRKPLWFFRGRIQEKADE
jgi:nitroreductase